MKCLGKKRNGDPCNRNACESLNYCYQHVDGLWNKVTYFLAEVLGVKKRFLFWSLIFFIVIFLVQLQITYQYNQILDNLKLKPDMEVEISPFIYTAAFGEYFPLIMTNTGDYTFNEVHVFINSCEMPDKRYEHYELPLLPAHSERTIPFGNKDIITAFKKGNCYPFSGDERSFASFSFNPYKIQQGENYTSTSIGCGVCYFDAKVFAKYSLNDKNETFKKNVSSFFSFPVDLTITISADDKDK